MIVLTIALTLVVAVLLLPLVADAIALLVAMVRRTRVSPQSVDLVPRLLVLIPAHDEESLIGACVSSLIGMDYPDERRRVVVVADNCSDETAKRAREAGAEALERFDEANPGKPRALDWALGRFELEKYDAVVIIDADTVVDAEMGLALANNAPLEWKGVQAYCAVENPEDSAITRMSAVFAAARYEFGFPLKDRAGINVPLMGNGMCIGTGILRRHGWRAFSICEDWELYGLLTADGYRIEGNPSARIYAQEARSIKESDTQRQRWSAGKITVLARLWPRLLLGRGMTILQRLDAFAELTHFGPAVHLGVVVLFSLLILLAQPPGSVWLLAGLGASVLRVVMYSILGLTRMPKPWRAVWAFAYLPFYTVWRMGVQFRSLSMLGDSPWVRTRRNS